VIVLPKRMTAGEYVRCLRVAGAIVNSDAQVVEVDASALRFIDPFALTLLAAACERIGQDDRRVEVVALHPVHGSYLGRMDLFRQPWISCRAAGQQERVRHDGYGSLVELKRLTHQNQVDATANALAAAVLGWVPGLDEKAPADEMTGYNDWLRAYEPLCHAFTELLQNAVTHARRHGHDDANVWVTAQYLRQSDTIHIGIVDTGCGFLRSLERHPELKSKTDDAAILLALRPRISCNRGLGVAGAHAANAGIGLTTTYRIVRAAEGRMLIASGGGAIMVAGDTDATSGLDVDAWRGAALGLRLRRAAMVNVNIRELMPSQDIGRPAPPIRFE
jgi:hypothetical protein